MSHHQRGPVGRRCRGSNLAEAAQRRRRLAPRHPWIDGLGRGGVVGQNLTERLGQGHSLRVSGSLLRDVATEQFGQRWLRNTAHGLVLSMTRTIVLRSASSQQERNNRKNLRGV